MPVALFLQLPEPLQDQLAALEDILLALLDAQGLGSRDRDGEQAVGAGLATRRFGDAALARGWSGGSRPGKGEIGRGWGRRQGGRRVQALETEGWAQLLNDAVGIGVNAEVAITP